MQSSNSLCHKSNNGDQKIKQWEKFFEFTFKQLKALNNIPLEFLNRLVSKGYQLFMIEDDKLIQTKPKTMAKLAAQTNHDYNLLAKL